MTSIRTGWIGVAWIGVLSLVLVGLGHVKAGYWRAGALLITAGAVFVLALRTVTTLIAPDPIALAAFIGLSALGVAANIAVAIDAMRRARRGRAPGFGGWLRSTWLAAVVGLAAQGSIEAFTSFGWQIFSIPSGSNMPTLMPGDWLVTDKRAFIPSRGDMIVFPYSKDRSVTYVKRVVGLPGDRVAMRNGVLMIQGAPVPRVAGGTITVDGIVARRFQETMPDGRTYSIVKMRDTGWINNTQDYSVPPGYLFVLGDNRDNSADSRLVDSFGYVPVSDLIGKAATILLARDRSRMFTTVD